MVNFIIVTFLLLAALVVASPVAVDGEDRQRAFLLMRFAIVSRAVCFAVLVAAICALVVYGGDAR